MQLSAEDYALLIDRSERDLRALGERLDTCVQNAMYETSILALAKRARTLFLGAAELAGGQAPASMLSLLRPAVEVNLTLRFLKQNPALHAELWVAEGERETLKLVRELERDRDLVEKLGEPEFPAGWHEQIEEFVDAARAKAQAVGVKGVGPSGSVIPSMWSIAFEHGDLATREAYTLAYRSLGHDVHGSARAFQRGRFSICDDGGVRFEDTITDDYRLSTRALNATTFASSLCVVSDPLGIDVLEEASSLKSLLLTATT